MFYVLCGLIGFAACGLIYLLYSKVNNKLLACALSCFAGILVATVITIIAVYMLPVTIAIAGGIKI